MFIRLHNGSLAIKNALKRTYFLMDLAKKCAPRVKKKKKILRKENILLWSFPFYTKDFINTPKSHTRIIPNQSF